MYAIWYIVAIYSHCLKKLVLNRDTTMFLCRMNRTYPVIISSHIINMIKLGLNYFGKFADKNFVICFLVKNTMDLVFLGTDLVDAMFCRKEHQL